MKLMRRGLAPTLGFIGIVTLFFLVSRPNNLTKNGIFDKFEGADIKQEQGGFPSSQHNNDFDIESASQTGNKDNIANNADFRKYTDTPFMPQMQNETLKAQLGNAAWKLFHTILARYPDNPSVEEQNTLSQYIYLFAQVYPCGDCSRHFQKLLSKNPPQVKSRKTAALWGCDIHNKVNKRLGKSQYDCATILEDYDCGCGEDEKQSDSTLNNETQEHLRQIEITDKESVPQKGG